MPTLIYHALNTKVLKEATFPFRTWKYQPRSREGSLSPSEQTSTCLVEWTLSTEDHDSPHCLIEAVHVATFRTGLLSLKTWHTEIEYFLVSNVNTYLKHHYALLLNVYFLKYGGKIPQVFYGWAEDHTPWHIRISVISCYQNASGNITGKISVPSFLPPIFKYKNWSPTGRILYQDSPSSLKPHLKIWSPKEVLSKPSPLGNRAEVRTQILIVSKGTFNCVRPAFYCSPSLKVESHFILKAKY